MIKCEICKEQFNKFRSLSTHIKIHNYSLEQYYIEFIGDIGKCLSCGVKTKFISMEKGYCQFCSSKCSNNSNSVKKKKETTCLEKYGEHHPSQVKIFQKKKKETCLKRFGYEHPSKSYEIKEKTKQTCLKKYGVNSPSQNKNIRNKQIKTMKNRYGVTSPSQHKIFKEKMKQTMILNHGVEYSMQSKEVQEKAKKTCLKNYGVNHPSQSKQIKEKIKQINLKLYGVENPLQNKNIRKKQIETMKSRYGVENPSQSEEIKETKKQTFLERYGVENPSQSPHIQLKIKETRNKSFFNRLINSDRLKEKCTPNFTVDEFRGTSYYKQYSWICTKCGNIFEDYLHSNIPRCSICYPRLNTGTSKIEKEISEFITFLGIKNYSTRKIISPLELDIYIPSHNLAIEFDGLYWHSELNGKDKNYHLNKTLQCKNKGIQLIHIFEDEWMNQQEIVKSIITAKLGLIQNRIYARKCQIKEVPNDDAKLFLFDNHLQGIANGNHIGLYYEDKLVSMITIGKSRFSKTYEYEIIRFCSKINTSVVGGLSKLLKYFILSKNPTSIITYADLRYGNGDSYLNCGFEFSSQTTPSYHYLDKSYQRFSRLQFQKHLLSEKLNIFDPSLTEWQNMQLNDYDRIWDCGTKSYKWNKQGEL